MVAAKTSFPTQFEFDKSKTFRPLGDGSESASMSNSKGYWLKGHHVKPDCSSTGASCEMAGQSPMQFGPSSRAHQND